MVLMWYNIFRTIYMEDYIRAMKVILERDMEIVFDIDKIVKALFAGVQPLDITMSAKERLIYHS